MEHFRTRAPEQEEEEEGSPLWILLKGVGFRKLGGKRCWIWITWREKVLDLDNLGEKAIGFRKL